MCIAHFWVPIIDDQRHGEYFNFTFGLLNIQNWQLERYNPRVF